MEIEEYLLKKKQRVILVIDAIGFSTKVEDTNVEATNENFKAYFEKIEQEVLKIENNYIMETPSTSGDCYKVLFEEGYDEEIISCVKNIIKECETINESKVESYKVYFKYSLHMDRFDLSKKNQPLTLASRLNDKASKYLITVSENYFEILKDDVNDEIIKTQKKLFKNFDGIKKKKFFTLETGIQDNIENLDSVEVIDYNIFHMPFLSKENDVVGIEEKLIDVHESLESTRKTSIGQVRTFKGLGGLGKTQLAVEYVYKYKENYKNIIWLTIDQNINEQFIKIIDDNEILGKNAEQDVKVKRMYEVIYNLEDSLLILDNTSSKDEIEKFYPKSSSNKILITTRNFIPEFKEIPLNMLNLENSQKLLEIESQRMVKEDEQKSVDNLIEDLDGLPLALEMAGAYVFSLDYDWNEYYESFKKNGLEFLEKSKIQGLKDHEINISNTLEISKDILATQPLLKNIVNILSYGANEPIDKKLLSKLLKVDEIDLIDPLQYGLKLKYFKENENGYNIHRLLSTTWKRNNSLEEEFINKVSKNLIEYMKQIKDEFLYLDDLNKASIQAKIWKNLVDDLYLKASLMNYSIYPKYHMCKYEDALVEVNNALNLFEKNDKSEVTAELLNNKGYLLLSLDFMNDGIQFIEQSLEMKRVIFKDFDHPEIAISLSNLEMAYRLKGEHDDAIKFGELNLEMLRRIHKENDHPEIAAVLNNLAISFYYKGNKHDAKINYMESLAIKKRLYGNIDHPSIATTLMNYYLEFHVEEYLHLSVDMRQRIYKDIEHPDISHSFNAIANHMYRKNNKYDAGVYFKKAFFMHKKLYGIQNKNTVMYFKSFIICLCENPVTKKDGIEFLKKTKLELKEFPELHSNINELLKVYDTVNRKKSKRKNTR